MSMWEITQNMSLLKLENSQLLWLVAILIKLAVFRNLGSSTKNLDSLKGFWQKIKFGLTWDTLRWDENLWDCPNSYCQIFYFVPWDKLFFFRKIPKTQKVLQEKKKYEKRCCFGYKGVDCTERVDHDSAKTRPDQIETIPETGKIFTCEDFNSCTQGVLNQIYPK